MSTSAKLRTAEKLAKSGNPAGALAIYQEILAKFPANAAAKKGMAALQGANVSPQDPQAAVAQINALMQAGKVDPARQAARALAKANPKVPQAHAICAQIEMTAGRPAEAAAHFERASKLAPNEHGFALSHINALIEAGQHKKAGKRAAALVKKVPTLIDAGVLEARALAEAGDYVDALAKLDAMGADAQGALNYHMARGNVLGQLGRGNDAIEAFEKAVEIAPKDLGALNNLSNELGRKERYRDALSVIERALKIAPGHPMLRENLALTRRGALQHDAALKDLKALAKDGHATPTVMQTMALCEFEIGNKDKARGIFEGELAKRPDDLSLLHAYGTLIPLDPDSDAVARLKTSLKDAKLSTRAKSRSENALFLAYDAAGDHDTAFAHLAACRALRDQDAPYDISGLSDVIDALEAMTPLPAPATQTTMPRPVFIAGMPRSGTTLVEQVLSNLDGVHAGGELSALTHAMSAVGWSRSRVGPALDADALGALRAHYAASLAQLETDAPVITDKMPNNFLWIGPALAAMPEAHVFLMNRDPMAVCWSNYRHVMSTAESNFANDFETLSSMYRAFDRLKTLWAERFPDQVTIVDYAALTENPEVEAPKLAARAGLTWDGAALDLSGTRAVRTSSAAQVRGQIYTGSDQAWRAYETHLAPLRDALGPLAK